MAEVTRPTPPGTGETAAAVPQAASLAEATGLTITADDGQPLV